MMKGARLAVAAAVVAGGLVLHPPDGFCEEGWRGEFEAACSRTSEAMALSSDELVALIERCDRMRKTLEAQDDTVAKVYLKRLEKCRNLYAYMLDYRKNQQPAP